MMDVSNFYYSNIVSLNYCTLPVPIPVQQYPVLTNVSLLYHMDNVHCTGREKSLNECEHNGYGIHNCALNREEAGAICNGVNFKYQKGSVWMYFIVLQEVNVLKMIFDWLMVQHLLMAELRYVWMDFGALCVKKNGAIEKLEWFADS